MALSGVTLPPMLLVNDDGKQIVSHAVPIQRRNAMQGVLLLSTRPGEIDEILDRERWVTIGRRPDGAVGDAAWPPSCWRAPSPVRCAGCRRPPSTSASTSMPARAAARFDATARDEVGQMAGAFREHDVVALSAHRGEREVCRRMSRTSSRTRLPPRARTADALTYAKTHAAAPGTGAADPGRAEAPQQADHRRLQRVAAGCRAGPAADGAGRLEPVARQRGRTSSRTSWEPTRARSRWTSPVLRRYRAPMLSSAHEGRLGQVLDQSDRQCPLVLARRRRGDCDG